uniref:Uncharacterized protein n=1 Tax=Meloidogyne enterolobii TaxID=390850 RepID=A0A6V7V0Z8_MELEN|nr:unnamed protein product [Meloidogyne enterolobii]
MAKHYVFKMMVMNEDKDGTKKAAEEDVSPNQLLYGPRILNPEATKKTAKTSKFNSSFKIS